MQKTQINAQYESLFGIVPATVEQRLRFAEVTGREKAVDAVEAMRQELLDHNPLSRREQQLVHFAMLIALGQSGPAKLHAHGALRAGATLRDLHGVAETAAITCGMPGYSLVVEICSSL